MDDSEIVGTRLESLVAMNAMNPLVSICDSNSVQNHDTSELCGELNPKPHTYAI